MSQISSAPIQTPDDATPDALYRDGMAAAQHGDKPIALALLRRASAATPLRGDIAYNLGVLEQQNGNLAAALDCWQRAASLSPQHAPIWVNLALGYSVAGQAMQARETYIRALTLHPDNRDLLFHYALFLAKANAPRESMGVLQTLLDHHPHDTAGLINAGKTAKTLGQYDKAEGFYARALETASTPELKAAAQFNRANLLLLQGRWAEGFAAYEARLQLASALPAPWGLPPFHESLPQGSRVLLWSDQGLGDALMYLRFAPVLAARGYRVSLFVQTPLKPLFADNPLFQAVYAPTDTPAPMDAALALGSLPHLLGFAPATAWQGPYVRSAHRPQNKAKNAPLRVGFVWAGNQRHDNDRNRSLSFADLAPLWTLPDIEWVSLQMGGEAATALRSAPPQVRITDASAQLHDFAATAALLETLDVTVTVDTALAHLAGAMGRPVYTLLPAVDSDWRWGMTGETTFWYPSMTLVRQTTASDWDSPLTKLCERLLIFSAQ